jgi:hypothetical protein
MVDTIQHDWLLVKFYLYWRNNFILIETTADFSSKQKDIIPECYLHFLALPSRQQTIFVNFVYRENFIAGYVNFVFVLLVY